MGKNLFQQFVIISAVYVIRRKKMEITAPNTDQLKVFNDQTKALNNAYNVPESGKTIKTFLGSESCQIFS